MIFLTGLMGSGKTTVGRLLARRLGWRFADTDALVVRRAKKSVAAIFRAGGEAEFRRLESLALRSLEGKRRLVVATGGGIVVKASNRGFMAGQGVTVHLAVPVVRLLSRLKASRPGERPLLKGGVPALRELARKRRIYYLKADFTVRASGKPGQVAAEVLALLKKKKPQVLHDKTAR